MTVQSNYEMVREFHKGAKLTLDQWPPAYAERELRSNLIHEEQEELSDELFPIADKIPTDRGFLEIEGDPDRQKVAKEIADLLYVAYGAAASFGIPIDKVFKQVHESNMSELEGAQWREDGKLLKGPNYKPPNLEWISK